MKRIDRSAVDTYADDDWILRLLDAECSADDDALTSQRWLRESIAKRAVYAELYGDLLRSAGKRILDVGGGLSGFTRLLADRHDYTLIDLMAHDSLTSAELARATAGSRVLVTDWAVFEPEGRFDVVVANDLFPNVDQRLRRFLDQMLPHADEIRLSLTYYGDGRWYTASRIDADEIMTIVAWDGEGTSLALRPYVGRIIDVDMDLLAIPMVSAWPNGRQVCTVQMHGGSAAPGDA